MRAEFKQDGYRDFAQRYSGTYGWYEKTSGSPLLVRLESIDSDSLKFTDKNNMSYFATPDSGNVFSFLPVVKGAYKYGNTVVVMKRIPAKQYRRGICEDNCIVQDLVFGQPLLLSFQLLESLFSKQEDSVAEFKKTLYGVAVFDNTFSIVGENVYLYENSLGRYDPFKRNIRLNDSLFLQEIQDVISQNSLDITVEVV